MAEKPALRHVIWDWNGTLLDDAWLCLEGINELLAAEGLPPLSRERYLEVFDFPVRDYYLSAGFDFSTRSFEELGAAFMEIYEARRLECELQKGAREILEALRRAGVRQSILSAYHGESLRELVAHFGLDEIFHETQGASDIYAHGKVEQGRAVIARLGLPPETVLMVGDTIHDAEVGEAMGVEVILVDAGHQARHRLEATGHPVLDDLDGVTQMLGARLGR